MTIALWTPVWTILMNIWIWLCDTCYWLFYKKPLVMGRKKGLRYHHLTKLYWYCQILAIVNWVVPLIFFSVWYTVIVQGCSSTTVRGLLEDICIGPYLGPENESPWYLDLWNPQGNPVNDSKIQPPLYIERIMTGHVKLLDTAKALSHQVSKTEQMAPGFVTQEIVRNLSRVQVIATDLYPHFENFSRSFCQEKDVMNHHFRTFVNAYTRAISRTDYMELSFSTTLIWPLWDHTLRFINYYSLIPWLPDPKLYSLQVKSEIRFQAKRFIDNSLAALNRIEISFSTMQQLHNSGSLYQLLGAAIDAINLHQQKLNQTIDRFKDVNLFEQLFSQMFSERKELRALYEHYARGDRMRSRINALMETISMYEIDSAKLKAELHHLRTSFTYVPSFEISSHGLIAVPATLQAQIRHRSFSWLRPSWGQGHNSGSRGLDDITTASIEYHYNLDMTDDNDITSLRSAIAQLCRERKNQNILSGSLYMICNIWNYAKTMSELDDKLLEGVQRSWVLERLEAIRRYEKEIGADYEYMARLAASVYQDFLHGTPVPEYLH